MEQNDPRAALECRNGDLKKFGELYEKSEYEKESDSAKIKELLKVGGMYRNYFYPEDVKIREVKVSDPELQMVKYMNWTDNKTMDYPVYPYPMPLLERAEK